VPAGMNKVGFKSAQKHSSIYAVFANSQNNMKVSLLNPDCYSSHILLPNVQHYVDSVARKLSGKQALLSVIVFGSAANGGYKAGVSDIGLIVIVLNQTSRREKRKYKITIVSNAEQRKLPNRAKGANVGMQNAEACKQFRSVFVSLSFRFFFFATVWR